MTKAEQLRNVRLSLGWTQLQMANALYHVTGRGVAPQHVCRWERGQVVPRGWIIDALASIWLRYGKGRPYPLVHPTPLPFDPPPPPSSDAGAEAGRGAEPGNVVR